MLALTPRSQVRRNLGDQYGLVEADRGMLDILKSLNEIRQ